MPLVINVTEENVSVQIGGNWFNFKPGQRKTIRSGAIANFISAQYIGYGLAVLPDLTTQEEDDGDIELTDETLSSRKAERETLEKSLCTAAFNDYISRQRSIIKNNQIHLARDLARKDFKYGPEHEMTDGELNAMRLVAKYDRKGKDAAQDRINEIEKLKKQIDTK